MMEKIMKWVREFFKRADVKEAEQKLVHAVVEKVEDAIQDVIADEPKAAEAAPVAAAPEAAKPKKPRKKRTTAKATTKAPAKKAK